MSDKNGPPEMSAEMMRNTSDLAAQAAQRAQQMLRKSSIGSNDSGRIPPDVPARSAKVPPEIPPKRNTLKRLSLGDDAPAAPGMRSSPPPPLPPLAATKQPPPLPQKPSSAHNSPYMLPKFPSSTPPPPQRPAAAAAAAAPHTPQLQAKFEKFIPTSAQIPLKFNDAKAAAVPQFAMISGGSGGSTSSPAKGHVVVVKPKAAPTAASPSDDLSSEDALRGIESGLRNMERAMQEQLNIRSREAAAAAAAASQKHKLDAMQFNQMEFKNMRGMGGGSISSLDGSNGPQMKGMDSMRMGGGQQNGAGNIRSMERGFSMDQMRLENLQQQQQHHHGMASMQQRPPMESNPNIRSAIEEMKMKGLVDQSSSASMGRSSAAAPIENHMLSLDRSLPLELQYSRHRQQEVNEFRDQMRQQLAAGRQQQQQALSREDLRIRRRSSHDENQITQAAPGKNGFFLLLGFLNDFLHFACPHLSFSLTS